MLKNGCVLVAEFGNSVLRCIDDRTGCVSTLAGIPPPYPSVRPNVSVPAHVPPVIPGIPHVAATDLPSAPHVPRVFPDVPATILPGASGFHSSSRISQPVNSSTSVSSSLSTGDRSTSLSPPRSSLASTTFLT